MLGLPTGTSALKATTGMPACAAMSVAASNASGSTRQTAMPSAFWAIAVCMALTISETTFFCEPVHW